EKLPRAFEQLLETMRRLEEHYRDMQDIEFTVEDNDLYLLQTRSAKRTAAAAVKAAVDMVDEELITREEAVARIDPQQLDQLLHPMLDPTAEWEVAAKGLNASPGAACGKIVLDADTAEQRGNADTPEDAVRAREFGAEGIGLCRTEHMFMAEERLPVVREMILAEDEQGRRAALDKLLPMQQGDFEAIFEAMAGLPVTIRLLDPPLHEFLPPLEQAKDERMRRRIKQLQESNPMLGTRGCRLGLQFP